MAGMERANTMTNAKEITCYGQVIGRGFLNEWYETASRDAGRRAKVLRKAGFKASVCAMGTQVTNVGYVKMTLVSVHADDFEGLPSVKVVRV